MAEQRAERRIAVGIDGSEHSRRALVWAAQHAAWHHVGLDVVHAWSVPYLPYGAGADVDPSEAERHAHELARSETTWLAAHGSTPDDLAEVLVEDEPGSALVTQSAEAELVVVGTRGRNRLAGLILGSVSQRCVDHAECPVAVVPSSWDQASGRRVVAGIDGSEPSRQALQWAFAEAASRHIDLEVVHAFGDGQVVFPYGPTIAMERNELEKAAHALLEDAVATEAARSEASPRSIELVAAPGAAGAALVEAAAVADLLVVGSRGRSTFRTLIAGSVAQYCARYAPCPVVVIRPPSHNPAT
jgi:nucleotide-binding universal stress UspA family protein